MKSAERRIYIVASSLTTLVAALFVVGYNYIKCHNHVYWGQMLLPNPTRCLAAAAPWWLVVPLVVFLLGMLWSQRPTAATAVIAGAGFFSIAWPLAYIWAWELPFIVVGVPVSCP